jgi:LysM repeat protein
LGTALGATAMDAKYLSKKIVPKKVESSPSNITSETVSDRQLKINIASELATYHSPVTADMVIATSKKFKVPAEYLMAFMKNDSHYGTA